MKIVGITDAEDEDDIVPTFSEAMAPNKSNAPLPKFSDLANKPLSSPIGALELPDIRDAVKNKQSQQKAEEEEEDDTLLPKIKRSDIEGFKKVSIMPTLSIKKCHITYIKLFLL